MKQVRKTVQALVVLILAIALPLSSASGHEIADGNARVERVRELTTAPHRAEGYIEYANPTIRSGGWSWMGISVSNPLLGDCHNGETNPANLRVSRVGWIKYASEPYAKVMGAWIGDNSQINIVTGGNVTSTRYYKVIGINENNWRRWIFQYAGSPTGQTTTIADTLYGPTVTQMKCVTAGGWTSSFNNAIGVSAVTSVVFYYYNNTGTYQLFSPNHGVRNNPYQYPSVTNGWQFYGNN